jgi:hypothetical protein
MGELYRINKSTLEDLADTVRTATGQTGPISFDEIKTVAKESIVNGVNLPTLSTPASASDILAGKEAINGEGNVLTGTIETKTSSDLTASGATVSVPAGYYATDASKSVSTTTQATPSVSVDANGKITATSNQSAGYVSAGTKTGTKQLTTQGAKTVTPSESSQTAVASGVYTTGTVTVNAIPDGYIVDEEVDEQETLISQIMTNLENKMVPSGVELPVLSNPASASDILSGREAIDGIGNILTGTIASQGAKTITPSTSNQTAISAGYYTTGDITVNGDSNLIAENIKSGVSIFGVAGSYEGSGSSSGGSSTTLSLTAVSCSNLSSGDMLYYTTFDGSSVKYTSYGAMQLGTRYRILISDALSGSAATLISSAASPTIAAGATIKAQGSGYYILEIAATSACCFVAGTQVLVSMDGQTKNIEDMVDGDDVVSYNVLTGENYIAKVNKLIVKTDTIDIADVHFDNGSMLTMNAYHPIYTEAGFHSLTNHDGYDTLVVGDNCKTVNGWSKITEINRYVSEPIITYNLSVIDIGEDPDNEINDTFFANGIVVHNAFPSGPSTGC